MLALLGSACIVSAGCSRGLTPIDFTDPVAPRWVGHTSGTHVRTDSLRVVSFNIAFSENVSGAIEVLDAQRELRQPDVLLLQEMDLRGVRAVAEALNLNYVYYPATRHPRKMKKDTKNGMSRAHPEFGYFGAAILSPWPLEDDQKILLGRGNDRALKVAVAATVRWGNRKVRAVSVHLPTPLGEHFEAELKDWRAASSTESARRPRSRCHPSDGLMAQSPGTSSSPVTSTAPDAPSCNRPRGRRAR